jgi:hypothetical protein
MLVRLRSYCPTYQNAGRYNAQKPLPGTQGNDFKVAGGNGQPNILYCLMQ